VGRPTAALHRQDALLGGLQFRRGGELSGGLIGPEAVA
jgi:hypothetical protein